MSLVVNGFDFHCHIDLFPDPAQTIAGCESARILTLAVTTTPKAWRQNQRWTASSRYVHAAIGLHPELAGERVGEIASLEQQMVETPFVGEIGLDGTMQHRKHWARQTQVFTRALFCADRLGGRVLSIHSRRAAADVLSALRENTSPTRVLPILHWFSGPLSAARLAIEIGCYFSINHRMLDNAGDSELLRSLPDDRLLTETDAPFAMAQQRSPESQQVQTTTRRLADVRGVSAESMAKAVAANASRVFAFAGIEGDFEYPP